MKRAIVVRPIIPKRLIDPIDAYKRDLRCKCFTHAVVKLIESGLKNVKNH